VPAGLPDAMVGSLPLAGLKIMGSKPATGGSLAVLSLGALGVVYGDIGTSPLYALRECFRRQSSICLRRVRMCSESFP